MPGVEVGLDQLLHQPLPVHADFLRDEELVEAQRDEPRFALTAADKDITLATELAEEVGVPVQLAEACRAEMTEALQRGLGELDSSVALTLQEERAGVEVRLA